MRSGEAAWSGLGGAFGKEGLVHVGDDGLKPLLAEKLDADIGGIQDGKRWLEQVLQLDLTGRQAPVLQQRKVLRLLGRDVLGYQPGMEVLGHFRSEEHTSE